MARISSKQANETTERSIVTSQRRTGARESLAVMLFAAAMFLFICLISYDYRDPSFNVATTRAYVANLGGLIGSHTADALVQAFGVTSLVVPMMLLILSLKLVLPGRGPLKWSETGSVIVLIAVLSAMAERFLVPPLLKFGGSHAGGAIGSSLHVFLLRFLGSGGELLLTFTIVSLCVLRMSQVTVRRAAKLFTWVGGVFLTGLAAGWQKWKNSHSGDDRVTQDYDDYLGPYKDVDAEHPDFNEIGLPKNQLFDDEEIVSAAKFSPPWDRLHKEPAPDPEVDWPSPSPNEERPKPARGSKIVAALGLSRKKREITVKELEKSIEDYLDGQSAAAPARRKQGFAHTKTSAPQGKLITVARRADESISKAKNRERASTEDDYKFPPVDLLDMPSSENRHVDKDLLESNAAVLEQKLADLGVQGEVVAVHPGPVITMYELTLAPGVPLRKILGTSDDLAMALKSGSTRVVAPIHGKNTVGIEVPNLNREIVYFREIIESPAFGELDDALKMAIGKGIDGKPFSTSLARMPHLLIAGATGTGKSVGLNSLICSWLMYCHPDDLKLLLVDPKKLELSYYQDIPHLLHPVVTEPEKVPKVLSWAIREMERRYTLLSQTGAKNVESYNKKVRSGEVVGAEDGPAPEKLPYIVIIVDELAELMMVAAKDIEISIARLAQMARASGIHLILATQRPSVDVITGVIKANFPARMSYQVSAKPDSRTILDTTGAEHLLGMGDMLFMPPGVSKLVRLHGAYLSENEIKRICDFIKAQRAPVYLQEITKHVAEDESSVSGSDFMDDPKYDEAVELVTRIGHASISLIQRHMRIGYNRAARIIEAMETEGLIGPSDGTSRPREVLARALDMDLDGRSEAYARE
jgi:DNA segregation ATPase FtsK/SpoIIIE, S-DNA-T family